MHICIAALTHLSIRCGRAVNHQFVDHAKQLVHALLEVGVVARGLDELRIEVTRLLRAGEGDGDGGDDKDNRRQGKHMAENILGRIKTDSEQE